VVDGSSEVGKVSEKSFYSIDSAGTIDGETITALLQPGTFGPNDNLLFDTEERFTNLGISFIAGGLSRNLFFFDSHELLTAGDPPIAVSFRANPTVRSGFLSAMFRSLIGA
jgi:hypothetical protein